MDKRDDPFMVEVPCNGCVRCCINDLVRILKHEDASKWKTETHPLKPWSKMLAHKKDGSCYYLGDAGCIIHDDRPQMCREMDCRVIAEHVSYTQVRKSLVRVAVWSKGKELLRNGR